MKRILVLLLTLIICLTLPSCGKNKPKDVDTDAHSDLAYVQDKGALVVGITEFKPMDYQDADGKWIGFDADLASAFAESLGVTVEFKLIEWDNKVNELNDKIIDVVWNGMTLNDDVKAAMETSNPYFNNAQVVIVKADFADKYQTIESLAGATFAVESSSSGHEQAIAHGFTYTEVSDMAAALKNVSSGISDAAIVDFLMAKVMIGEGTGYDDLTYTVSLSSEEYGVGFRKGSDLAAELNSFFAASYSNGTMQTVARTYGITAFLLPQ